MARKSPRSVNADQASEKASFFGTGIRLESGWKPACHFFRFRKAPWREASARADDISGVFARSGSGRALAAVRSRATRPGQGRASRGSGGTVDDLAGEVAVAGGEGTGGGDDAGGSGNRRGVPTQILEAGCKRPRRHVRRAVEALASIGAGAGSDGRYGGSTRSDPEPSRVTPSRSGHGTRRSSSVFSAKAPRLLRVYARKARWRRSCLSEG